MHPYLPHTQQDIEEMLKVIGVNEISDLFKDIPKNIRFNRELNLSKSMSEIEVSKKLKGLADANTGTDELISFLGAGAYDHYIPSIVNHIAGRSEFYTAYTPYQPEISQGTLQAIFEYQTMITELTGLYVSNASLYDGATACSEAAFMAHASTRRKNIIVSKTVNPQTRKVLQTYLHFKGLNLIEVDEDKGSTNTQQLLELINKDTAAVIIQSPNFFGVIEDVTEIEQQVHKNKALLIMSVDPISLALLKSPGELGADIAVGEGQALGNAQSFGGPYLGFIATTKKLMRKIPGRVVGETIDSSNSRGFVLTMQAREQHIRREKATSNITSNQALNALMAAVYLATLGKKGLKEVATQSVKKAHYAAKKISTLNGYDLLFNKPFFKEFAVKTPNSIANINNRLLQARILGGYDLSNDYHNYNNSMLLAVTEKRTKAEIDSLVKELEGVE